MILILRYLLAFFWIFMGTLHFVRPRFYLKLMPSYLPYPSQLVAISGVTEILAGILVLFESTAVYGGMMIIGMLTVFMLVHIDMLIHAKDKFSKISLWILWLRLPLQFVLAYWAWLVIFNNAT